jgi:hypothetical protein
MQHHFVDQIGEQNLWYPAKLGFGLGSIAEELLNLGRSKVARIDPYEHRSRFPVHSYLVDTSALPHDLTADASERPLDELANRVHLSCSQYVVVRRVLLQNPPHTVNVVARVTPVTQCIQVAEVQVLLQPVLNCCHCSRDLARDERLAAHRPFVIEENAFHMPRDSSQ